MSRTKNKYPRSLRLTEASVDTDYEGRKFIRMEQSYALAEDSQVASLVLRVELSWDHAR